MAQIIQTEIFFIIRKQISRHKYVFDMPPCTPNTHIKKLLPGTWNFNLKLIFDTSICNLSYNVNNHNFLKYFYFNVILSRLNISKYKYIFQNSQLLLWRIISTYFVQMYTGLWYKQWYVLLLKLWILKALYINLRNGYLTFIKITSCYDVFSLLSVKLTSDISKR